MNVEMLPSLLPLSTGTSYFCFLRWSLNVLSQIKLGATAFILFLVLKAVTSFLDFKEGLESV